MPRLKSRRSVVRRLVCAANNIEWLESRRLLSATVVTQIPTQSIGAGQASTSVTLSNYLNDPQITGGTIIKMETPLGNIPLQLTDSRTPNTVSNFVKYITNGDYVPTVIQRAAPGFVLQGGGTKPDGSNNASLGDITSEAGISNTAGTIAVALSNGPDTGNNQWFINLGNNASLLDGSNDGGPFTVFGNVIDQGLAVATTISKQTIINGSAENSNWYIGQNDGLPVINYTGSSTPTTVPQVNLVTDNVVTVPASQAVTYSVSSANSSLVTASINNGALTLTPNSNHSPGTTTVTATVTDLSGGTASSTFVVNVTGGPAVSVASASGQAGTGKQVVFPVTLSPASASDTTITYSLTPGTASAADFQASGSSITIPAGSTQGTIAVNVPTDTSGSNETFTLTLSSVSSNAVFANNAASLTATGTIQPVAAAGATSTAISLSSTSIAFGTALTINATITPAAGETAATGTVAFYVSGISVGTGTVSGNAASTSFIMNLTGTQNITAIYSGDPSNSASTSAAETVTVSAPSVINLSIVRSTLPLAVITGRPVKGQIVVDLTNGNMIAPLSGVYVIHVYPSVDGMLTPGGAALATATHKLSLAPGKSTKITIPISSVAGALTDGKYTLLLQATDPSGVITDPVLGNTLSVSAPTISLTPSFVHFPLPLSVIAGAKTAVTALVKITNSGNVTSSGVSTIALYAVPSGSSAPGTLLKSISRRLAIKVGGSANVSIPVGTYPATLNGDYDIIAQVTDSEAHVTTGNYSSSIIIAPQFKDLSAKTLVAPATAASGKIIPLSLDVTNLSNIAVSGPLVISFTTSATSDGTNSVPVTTITLHISLPAAKSKVEKLRIKIPAGTITGAQFLNAIIDPTNTFAESDTTNNFANVAITIS